MNTHSRKSKNKTDILQVGLRLLLGTPLFLAGLGHLSWLRVEFQAQVPPWLPLDPDLVVVLSGVIEIGLGLALMLLPRYKAALGWITAVFLS